MPALVDVCEEKYSEGKIGCYSVESKLGRGAVVEPDSRCCCPMVGGGH